MNEEIKKQAETAEEKRRQKAEAQFQKRIDDLLLDKVKPSHPFAEYIVQRMKETRNQREELMHNLSQLERRVEAMRMERVALEGQMRGYVDDLRRWDKADEGAPEVPAQA